MDKFTIGNRVQVVALHNENTVLRVGMTGTVTKQRAWDEVGGQRRFVYEVVLDNPGFQWEWCFEEYCLAPLNEQTYERFMERVLNPVEIKEIA